MGRIYNNIIETVGRTPLVKLNKVTAGVDATILLKCEFFNPLGSVKDRIGMAMIEARRKKRRVEKRHRHHRADFRQHWHRARVCRGGERL